MSKQSNIKVSYGNWTSKHLLYIPALVTIFFASLCFISIFFIIPAVLFLLAFAYFTYAYYQFSVSGGDIQTRIWDMTLDYLKWNGDGRAIDIGCGNGMLTIKLAGKYPQAQITGIDYWGGKWDYSREACEKNARIEGVSDRTSFFKASAAILPFEDEYFNAAISNFVFHEVHDAKDKRSVIREALRVVNKGGVFAFHDLFLTKKLYGDIDDLLETMRGWGISEVSFAKTRDSDFIPGLLKPSFMMGTIGIIYGSK